ncbi:MAG: hypothetical protein V3S42_00335, partial [Candidatus Neomarinimicrobiota bacterium]
MKKLNYLIAVLAIISLMFGQEKNNSPKFNISFAQELSEGVIDGRVMLLISTNDDDEPRFQISDDVNTQLVFGIDVEGITSNDQVRFTGVEFGYPLSSLSELPEGDYYVQALLHKYETFNLSTGHTVMLPMDYGEGQKWNTSPGNYLSKPQMIHIMPGVKLDIKMTEVIPPIEPPQDTKYIKHVQMKSELLSKFWGRDMYLGANVL